MAATMRLLRETRLVFVRSLRPILRNPVSIVVGIAMPLVYLLLFGPLLRGLAGGNSWQWFVPGIMVQMALFGTAYAGFALIPEIRSGALERLRVTPISRTALLLGRVAKDVLMLVVQSGLLAAIAALLGFRASIWAVLLGLVLLAVLGVAVGALSHALALILKQEYTFAPVLSSSTLPLMLLAGVLLPMSLAPRWLYDVSRVNPLAHVVDAERAIIAGHWTATSVWLGPLVAVALAAVCLAWGVRVFRRQNA